ncbi:TRM11 family SAM-dependent methyltransferase [Vibrio rarus]|uniref:TRM11 family SAM-dependent methyltransferase n=1 Tax=Vibrio rarus TaxID=413403 RepID=UPI0021C381B0|nr:DNA methylase [Vibrio rarus]
MFQYAILANPGHNRIYFDTAVKIACSELKAMLASMDIRVDEVLEKDIGLPAALVFETEQELDALQLKRLSSSSIYYAIFQVLDCGLLKPLQPQAFNTFPESMSQILRYTGKTNEQFTRLMVNLGLSAAKTNSERKCLMDPMCGKGTTLYEGLIQGLDVIGVEINAKWVQEIQTFIVKYMKNGRYKHKVTKEKRTGEGGKKIADGFAISAAVSKEDFANGLGQSMKLYASDTRIINQIIKKNSCDVMVSDLPYGVQHGSKSAKDTKMARSPLGLIEEALPAWKSALKPKGAVVLSFNEFTLKWSELAKLFAEQGFEVQDAEPYIGYLHRVDQSINRNIFIAVKP